MLRQFEIAASSAFSIPSGAEDEEGSTGKTLQDGFFICLLIEAGSGLVRYAWTHCPGVQILPHF